MRQLKNKSGVILVTVILLIIVLSVVAIGVMGLNLSQIKTSSSVVESVVAEELSTGLLYLDHQRRIDGVGTIPTNIIVGSKRYTITRDADTPAGPNYNDTNQVRFNITY